MERNLKLYEIESEILNCIDPETGEIIDEERLDALEMERTKKIENILCWIKNLNADAEAIKAEKNALAEREKTARNKVDRLKEYISGMLNGEKFTTSKVSVSWRKSEAVVVDDLNALVDADDSFVKYSEPTPDKTRIKTALKQGVNLPGCRLEERCNLTIK